MLQLTSDGMLLRMLKSCGALERPIGDKSVWSIFDDEYFDAQPGDALVGSSQPRLTCRTSDVSRVLSEAQVEVDGAAYRVSSNQPDGTGISILWLRRDR